MPQVSAAVLRSTPSSTSAIASFHPPRRPRVPALRRRRPQVPDVGKGQSGRLSRRPQRDHHAATVVDFRNGAVGVNGSEFTRLQHDRVQSLAKRRRWRCGDITHRSGASAGPTSRLQAIAAELRRGVKGDFPNRDDASVRGRRGGRHIMPGSTAVPECPSFARSRTQAFGNKSTNGIIGDRVPAWDLGAPAPSGVADLSFCWMGQWIWPALTLPAPASPPPG